MNNQNKINGTSKAAIALNMRELQQVIKLRADNVTSADLPDLVTNVDLKLRLLISLNKDLDNLISATVFLQELVNDSIKQYRQERSESDHESA